MISTLPCASSSVKTAIRSPFFVLSGLTAATIPPMLVSGSIGFGPAGPQLLSRAAACVSERSATDFAPNSLNAAA